MIYAEGKHDDPADTQERLIKVGSKYQATAPAVADGDNVYLLVDAAGRILVTGPVASDAVAAGNPIPIGGDVDDTSPAAAAEGDRRVFRSTPEGNQIVELYKDNNALSPLAAMPGAGEVTAARATINNSTTRTTLVTPTSGKKIRIISVTAVWQNATTQQFECYFGTGTDLTTNAAKAIHYAALDADVEFNTNKVWPDGAGPVGAADDVLSIRASTAIAAALSIIVHYREE